MLLQVVNLCKNYGNLQVTKNINLNILEKEIIAIVGASGAGKSTLLQMLGTLENPTSGEIYFENKPYSQFSEKTLSQFRNQKIGFIFQFHHLLPEFTALENVCIPAMIAKQQQYKQKAVELLKFLKLEDRMHHKPSQLSGGEQQRVAVARALINRPKIIFADEPSGNLDTNNATELHKLFFDIRNQFGTTFIIVTHNNQLAADADRIITLKDGEIINPN